MPEHEVGTQEEFDAAREELLAEEKELTRRSDELARKRQELPWVPVEKDYSFETEAGTKSLAELFDARRGRRSALLAASARRVRDRLSASSTSKRDGTSMTSNCRRHRRLVSAQET
jgi:predicted dithiol-disulfide oxidoreductase (DUF899 family)